MAQVIYPDLITSIYADKQNPNYPIENVENDYIKKVYKSSNNLAIITARVSAGDSIGIYGTNATYCGIDRRIGSAGAVWHDGDPTGVQGVWHDGIGVGQEGIWKAESLNTETVTLAELETGQTAIWANWTDPGTGGFSLIITLNCEATAALKVGVIRAGTSLSLADPQYGINEGLHDYSVSTELNNGSWYYLKRDIVRTFSFSLFEDRASDFYSLMHAIALLRGRRPLAWRLSDNVSDWQWIVFATMDALPSGSHDHRLHTNININLKEVV